MEELDRHEFVFIHQKGGNEYIVSDLQKKLKILWALEDAGRLSSQDPIRQFKMRISDKDKKVIIQLYEDQATNSILNPTKKIQLIVEHPPGNKIAVLRRNEDPASRVYEVYNMYGELVYKVVASRASNTEKMFTVNDAKSGAPVARITKKWGGWMRELTTTENDFIVQFPKGSDPVCKSALIGTTILIDYTEFEGQGKE